MSRWPEDSLDSRQIIEGDAGFIGFNDKLDRSQLPPKILARSQNKRMVDAAARDRPGTDYPINFQGSFGNTFAGSGIFSNPLGPEVMLVAENGADFVWQFTGDNVPSQIPIDTGGIIPTDEPVFITQSFNNVLILRGANDQPALVWNGTDPSGFQQWGPPGPGRTLIPNVWYGVPFDDRMLYAANPSSSQLIMSDVLDFQSYSPLDVFNINAGAGDHIAAIVPYSKQSVIIFMSRSIRSLSNFTTIDPITFLPTGATQDTVNNQLGIASDSDVPIAAPVVQIGGDMIFLSKPGGFYRLGDVVQQVVQTQPVPISDPIQGTVNDFDWGAIGELGAPSAVLGIYAYFAVRLLNNPNSVLLAYNTATSQWESVDFFGEPTLSINALHVMTYQDQRRLFAVDYINSAVYLIGEGTMDVMKSGTFPVKSAIETRGYGSQSGSGPDSFKSFRRTSISFATRLPSINVTALSDGVNEEKLITPDPVTKNPLKNYRHGIPDFDPSVDDPNTPKREDYGTTGTDPNVASQDFEAIATGDITVIPPSAPAALPTVLGPKQQFLFRRSVGQTGRWCSIRIENFSGQADVLGVNVESIEKQNFVMPAA